MQSSKVVRNVRIFRYDPVKGGEGTFQSYQLTIDNPETTTILDVLARYNVRGVQLNVDDKGALAAFYVHDWKPCWHAPAVSRSAMGGLPMISASLQQRKTRTRRSMLFVPGANAAMVSNSFIYPADA